MTELTLEQIDELDRELAAEERYIESTGSRTTSYRWLQRCRSLLALARDHAALRQRLEALQKELSVEARKIDAKMDADDYNGDLDADELEANTIRLCFQKLTAALETKGG